MDANLHHAMSIALGTVMEHPDRAGDVFAMCTIDDFESQYRLVAEAIHGLRLAKTPVSRLAVIDEMTRRGTLGRIGGAVEVHRIAGFGFGPDADYAIGVIVRTSRLRRLHVTGIRLSENAQIPDADPREVAQLAATSVQAVLDGIEADGDINTPTLREFLAQDDDDPDWVLPGILERGDRFILTGSEGAGKRLRVDEPIPTPDGWTVMGALRPGDHVFDRSGRVCTVTAVSDIDPFPDAWTVVFDDGTRIDADAEHQWLTVDYVARQRDHRPSVVTTEQIRRTMHARGGHTVNHAVPVAGPLDLPDTDLPVPPYTLGVWLGDGNTNGGLLTLNRDDAPAIVAELGRDGTVTHEVPSSDRAGSLGLRIEGGSRMLRVAALVHAKHIPAAYLRASIEQRTALLAGLMDTDGTVTDRATGAGRGHGAAVCELTFTCKALAADALELIRSLGIKVSIAESAAVLEGRTVGRRWRMQFQTPFNPFRAPRKADRWVPLRTRRAQYRYVVDVQRAEPTPMRCIAVDSPDRTYLAGRRMVPTHNSVLFRQLAVAAAAGIHPFTHADITPHRVLYVDVENGVGQLRRALRALAIQAGRHSGAADDGMFLECVPAGLDLTTAEDEAWLVNRVAALQPALLVIGPVYRLHAKNPNDEEPARAVTRVLDRCRSAANCALILEAHAGHGTDGGGNRNVRPVGSSLWLRWPEFGYGLRPAADYTPENRLMDVVPWRGDRSERSWPKQLRAGGAWPWQAVHDSWSEPTPAAPSYYHAKESA